MRQTTDQGLYIHVPFCHQRCHFCAFYLEIHHPHAAVEFVASLLTEVRLYAEDSPLDPRPLGSIYFGGGTPTTLDADHLTRILSAAREAFGLESDAEVTVEAHPGSVTSESLRELRSSGFTRLSLGAESMNQSELDRVGRPGSPLNTRQVLTTAREAGFENINLDLMYGLPGQTVASWNNSLQEILALNPTHLSCYALTVEDGTALQTAILRGRIPAPDESLQNELEDLAETTLAGAGYRRYEISNYCRPGFASRHNRLHWTGGHYLGLGPSAQSSVGGRRFGNVSNLAAYHSSLQNGRLPVSESEQLSRAHQACDRLIFGLRLTEGVALNEINALSFRGLAGTIDRLAADRLLERNGHVVRLAARGRRYADTVAVALLAGIEEAPHSASALDFSPLPRQQCTEAADDIVVGREAASP
ncbi:radical SAM family heme chaperone HemW [Nitrospira defluvii]|uniref:Heme chaperone HemW n=1 Tax=Nitrospira defluvii TaxID=330214 RepID=A0ABM8R0H6_9BACT|nr:radical SAM family heme chaperone HemW [Nitrospira defluvii]CAE6726091.1 Heme chaperone HemW [Nitrospira defluvii]